MSISINTDNFESAKAKIISKVSGKNGADSWVIKYQSQLHHKSTQWGDLGYFRFHQATDSENIYLILQQTEEGANSEKWETAVGSLHGDMIQLLINHVPELSATGPKRDFRIHVSNSFSEYAPS